ncbi:MAG TPA: UDP-N-acetylmuramate:L-alanyl-gamma-D-glutamyl-meso-diaminopimelate ligase, partial [Thermoanaerobaculia bacterium]|nr:UDP-N-acetylmuramate:L-alanyl-gamma-D-glutamyl-meso-diaminopimelate ligase [Thermoanaerobaculia bacterium]
LVAAFEPRSLSAARRMFHDAYRDAFAVADRLLLAPVFYAQRLPADERLDVSRLAAELGAGGTPTAVTASIEALREQLLAEITAGDVVACMSSGSFEDLPRRLLQALRQREAAARPQT